MSTTQSTFDLSAVTLAFSAHSNAINAFDSMTSDMLVWYAAGEYPDNSAVITALTATGKGWSKGTLKTYASSILKWSRSGQIPQDMRAMVNTTPKGHTKGAGGRPVGKGKGKSTAAQPEAAAQPPEASNDTTWKHVHQIANQIAALAAKLPAISADDQALMGDLMAKVAAVARRYLP